MTKEKLLAIMESAQLSRNDLSAVSGRTTRQTYAWTTGAAPVPRPLALVLYALEDNSIDVEWLAKTMGKDRE